jgi:hypothetical protein
MYFPMTQRIVPNHQMLYYEENMRRTAYSGYPPLLASRPTDYYGYSNTGLPGFGHRPDNIYSVRSNDEIGALDTAQSNIIIPSASKDAKEGPKDRVYMEDDDNKLHVPIPTRSLPFQKKEATSAFRSSAGLGGRDAGKAGPQGGLAGRAKNEPEVYCQPPQGEPGKAPLLRIELSHYSDDGNEKPHAEELHAPLKLEDDDDDEDLFDDGSDRSSPRGKAQKGQESEAMLDKRGESDKSDDEDLFVGPAHSGRRRPHEENGHGTRPPRHSGHRPGQTARAGPPERDGPAHRGRAQERNAYQDRRAGPSQELLGR